MAKWSPPVNIDYMWIKTELGWGSPVAHMVFCMGSLWKASLVNKKLRTEGFKDSDISVVPVVKEAMRSFRRVTKVSTK